MKRFFPKRLHKKEFTPLDSNLTEFTSHTFVKKVLGFTFIEVIVVITISTISFIAITSFIMTMYRANSYAMEQALAIDQARRGVLEMVQYIRGATVSDTGSFPLTSAGTSTFTFYSDIDVDVNVEKVRYFLEDGTFKRGIIKSTGYPLAYTLPEEVKIIAENVHNVANATDIFTYYDKFGAEVTNLDEVADMTFVKVNLIININPSRAPEDFTLRSGVSIRNLKTNL